MTESKRASPPSLGSNLTRVAAHAIQPQEHEELPELTDDMVARGAVNKGGRPRSANPKRLISIRGLRGVGFCGKPPGRGWKPRLVEDFARSAPG